MQPPEAILHLAIDIDHDARIGGIAPMPDIADHRER
jgi:hypothetical protein